MFEEAGASKDGADAGEDFADAEGFGDVVVGAEFQPDDGINFFGFGSEEEKGDLGVFASDAPADFVAIQLGHHDVEADEVGLLGVIEADGFLAVRGGDGVEAVLGKDFDQGLAGVVVVFGYEYFDGVRHLFLGCERKEEAEVGSCIRGEEGELSSHLFSEGAGDGEANTSAGDPFGEGGV